MSTEKQREANRANAQKSTGPITPSGKARCRLNGLSHGFAAKTIFLLDENPDDFWALLADFMADLHPANRVEQALVEKIVQSHWTSLRASAELSVMWKRACETEPGAFMLAQPILSRYQAAADRNFHRCLADLLKLQKQRQKDEIGSAPQNDSETPETQPDPPAETAPEPPQEAVATPPESPKQPSMTFSPSAVNVSDPVDAEADELLRQYREKRQKLA